MKKFTVCLISYLIFSFISAQSVKVVKLKELKALYNKQNDTTYIVNFWATWCKPCVKELPIFDSLSQKIKNEKWKYEILLVSMDFKEDLNTKLKPFLKKNKLSPKIILLDETDANQFIPSIDEKWTGAIPATLIVRNNRTLKFIEKAIKNTNTLLIE
jgi:thiol-disulfide isomerase/thioredoxin